jgi:curved DNA-binding protein CbpA
MSAPLAGKFTDHYEVLGVEPKAEMETIKAAYARLAQLYHPNNPETGDKEKFELVAGSYEILCDPVLRKEFDKVKGIGEEGGPKFTGLPFFQALGRENALRTAMLCVLYDRRRTKPFTPSLSMRNLENTLSATQEELNFALWYLKQRSLVSMDDKSSFQITVDGMDFLEENRPDENVVMPLIKAAALAAAPVAPPVPIVAIPVRETPPEPKTQSLGRTMALADKLLRENRQRRETN